MWVTLFEVYKAITDPDEFAEAIWHMVRLRESSEEVAESLKSEVPEERLQLLRTAAREGIYPLSLEQLQ